MKKHAIALMAVLATAVASSRVVGEPPKDGIDGEGYVYTWLVLAPIPFKDVQAGADALGQSQLKGEGDIKPKAGDNVDVAGKEVSWKECQAKDQALDFNDVLGSETENSVGYAVAYIMAAMEMKDVTLKLGSDDQVKVYLNGKLIHDHDEARPFEKDEDSISNVLLKKDMNVLVVKVVNEEDDWLLSARFLDQHGKPVVGLKVTSKPD